MKKSTQFYGVNSEWQYQLSSEKKRTILKTEQLVLPQTLGQGQSYFSQITSGIFAMFIDFTLTKPIKIKNKKSKIDFYVLHFDLSSKNNSIVINNINYKTGASLNSYGVIVLRSNIESSFSPTVGERTLVLRLLIDKKTLSYYSNNNHFIRKIAADKKYLHYYDTVDSNSILLIESINKKRFYPDVLFDSYLKGVSLKILGNFLGRYSTLKDEKKEITESEKIAIIKTKDYLLKNLHNPFPSISFLSKMVQMSPSRYISLFKLKYEMTPNNYFIKEKILLSNTLLKSGKYNSLTEIIYELNYNRLSYFSSKYFFFFNRKPSDDFIKSKY